MFKLLSNTVTNKLISKKNVNFLRLSHTDLKVPDFSSDRRKPIKNENKEDRKAFTYLIIGGNVKNPLKYCLFNFSFINF